MLLSFNDFLSAIQSKKTFDVTPLVKISFNSCDQSFKMTIDSIGLKSSSVTKRYDPNKNPPILSLQDIYKAYELAYKKAHAVALYLSGDLDVNEFTNLATKRKMGVKQQENIIFRNKIKSLSALKSMGSVINARHFTLDELDETISKLKLIASKSNGNFKIKLPEQS